MTASQGSTSHVLKKVKNGYVAFPLLPCISAVLQLL